MTIRVLLADDQALLRATFSLLLGATPDMRVVGEASTGSQAIAMARRTTPDIVLMDIRMPDTDGIAATEAITADPALVAVKVVMLTTFETDELVAAALRAGASGYLGKGIEPAALIDAIRTVHAGDSLLSPTATTALIDRFLALPDRAERPVTPAGQQALEALTEREIEVVAHVAAGLSNAEIGQVLFISPATAKTHVSRALNKVGARDRAQLVVFAYEHGLVRPGHTGQSSN